MIEFYFNKPIQKNLVYDTWNKAFKQDLDEGRWEWKFLRNPNSEKVYVSYMLEDGVLASHYAVSPLKLNYNGQWLDFGLINTAMTRPGYEGRGYLGELAKALHKELEKDGFVGLITFPTRQRTLGIFKYNFQWIDLQTLKIWQVTKPLAGSNHYTFKTGKVKKSNLTLVAEMLFTEKRFYSLRNEINMGWRYIEHPVNQYYFLEISQKDKVEGLFFYKVFGKEIDLMDGFYSVMSISNEIYASAVNFFLHSGFKGINTWTTGETIQDNRLKLIDAPGFLPLETYLGLIPLNNKWDLSNGNDWFISFYDSDVY